MFLIGMIMGTESLSTLFKLHILEKMEIYGVKPKLEDLRIYNADIVVYIYISTHLT